MSRLFFILLLLGLMIIHGSATATTDEQVWVIQSSGNIGLNEKIEYGRISVKVHEFRDDRVSLAVYEDNNFLELFDFYEGEWRQYQDTRLEVHRIEGYRTLIAISTLDTRTIWTEFEPMKAFWGDYIRRDVYGIEIFSFENDSVTLIVYENRNKLEDVKYHIGDEYQYLDDFKIHVSNIESNGYVELQFFKKLPLSINGNVKTQKELYRPNEKITFQIEITNSGNTPINLVEMDVRTDPYLHNDLIQTTNDLFPNQTYMLEVPVLTTDENENSNILMEVDVTLIDYFGNKYSYSFSKNIYISTSIGITKEIIPHELEFQDKSRNVQNVAMVQLNVFNVGTTSKNLSIIEHIPDNISLYNSSYLEWTREIAPGEFFNITYYITPDIPGEYTLPAAEVFFDKKMILSGKVLFSVHGPIISIQKSANVVGDIIIVTNNIQNTGTRAANVIVADNIPEKSMIINGNEFWTKVMQPGESGKFNYSLQNHKELDSLPAASVQYLDIRGNTWYSESNSVELKPIGLRSDNMKSDTNNKNFMIFLGFSYITIIGLIICVLIIIGSIIYIWDSKQDKV
ncbi:MAG TPA: hypothetical protein VMW53_01820 [archaeon]|nr:hypothetical protein [archaeon]